MTEHRLLALCMVIYALAGAGLIALIVYRVLQALTVLP